MSEKIIIVGGGAIGSSIAYFLSLLQRKDLEVLIVLLRKIRVTNLHRRRYQLAQSGNNSLRRYVPNYRSLVMNLLRREKMKKTAMAVASI